MELAKRNTLTWIAVTVILFPILVLAGVFLRFVQGNTLGIAREWFYPMMTLHGVGMVGVWYVGGMACVERIIAKYTRPSDRMSFFAIIGTVIGVVLLLVSVFVGKFAARWYFLYPLPLTGNWPTWSAVVFLLSLTVLGATWLLWCLDLLRAIAKQYTISKALGWHYLAGQTEPEVPPAIIITTVSLIAAVACLLSGVIVLVLFYVELLTGAVNDALLMKNLTFFFGHILVNLSLYLGVVVIYDVLPQYCGRPWKANKIVALSWNSVLAIVMFAYFHHLYMDFVHYVPEIVMWRFRRQHADSQGLSADGGHIMRHVLGSGSPERASGEAIVRRRKRGQATFCRPRDDFRMKRTCMPRRASMSIRLSVLKRSIRPRNTSLTRGCVTRRILAAFACVSPREAIAF